MHTTCRSFEVFFLDREKRALPAGGALLSQLGEAASLSLDTPLLVSEKATAWLLRAFWAGVRLPASGSKSGQGVLSRTGRTLHMVRVVRGSSWAVIWSQLCSGADAVARRVRGDPQVHMHCWP